MRRPGQPERTEHPTVVARKSDREIVVTRSFDSPPRAVFDAWTRPELFRRWWAPKSMGAVLSACEIDARTGGGYRITFGDGEAGSATFFGRYLEVTPPSRLVWTNEETQDGPVTTVTFEDEGERTRLVFSELYASEPPPEAVSGMQAMMSEQFAQLDALLATGPGVA